MGPWAKWWAGKLLCLKFIAKHYPFTCFNLVLFVQVRDEYRTDYDPDILLAVAF